MKTIVVVGLDNEKSKDFARELATELKLKFVSMDELLEEKLVCGFDFPLENANELMESMEKILIENLLLKGDLVVSVSNEMFISNKEVFDLNRCFVLCLEEKPKDALFKNLQKLITSHSTAVIKSNMDFKLIKKLF